MFVLAASGPLGGPATYFQAGWLAISLPNLLVVLATVVVFVLAVLLPFPHDVEEERR